MKSKKSHVKLISLLTTFMLIFLWLPLTFGATSNTFIFEIVCEKNHGISCSKNDNESKQNTLSITNADIQCISATPINKDVNITVHGRQDSMDTILKEESSGKMGKNDKIVKISAYKDNSYNVNLRLSESAGNKLFELTSNNIGKSLQLSYNNKILITAIIHSPLSNNFVITSILGNTLNQIKKDLNLKECQS